MPSEQADDDYDRLNNIMTAKCMPLVLEMYAIAFRLVLMHNINEAVSK